MTNAKIFVEGPYGNAAAAQQSADSLQGVEAAAGGGLYMVSAPLTAHVDGVVNEVAGCLSTTTGQGTLPAG